MRTFKKKLTELRDKIKNMKTDSKVVVASGLGIAASTVPAFAEGTLIDVTGVDFMAVLDEIVALVPVLLPVIIGFIAFRKGFGFLKSALKGA